MKTVNMLKKAAVTLAAMGLTLALLVHPADAQGTGKGSGEGVEKNRKSTEQVSYATQSASSYAAEIEARKASYRKFDLVDLVDEPMQLERWMVDKRYFVDRWGNEKVTEEASPAEGENNCRLSSEAIMALLVPVADEPLKLEAWMTDDCSFPCKGKKPDNGHEHLGIAVK